MRSGPSQKALIGSIPAAQSFHLLHWLTAACPLALLHCSLHDVEALTHLYRKDTTTWRQRLVENAVPVANGKDATERDGSDRICHLLSYHLVTAYVALPHHKCNTCPYWTIDESARKFPSSFPLNRREEMLPMMNNAYLLRRMVLCGFWVIALLVVLASCGQGSGRVANNTASPTDTGTAIVGTTNDSPTSTPPTVTPKPSRPSPTPTKATPTPSRPSPTPTRTTPTPTPTSPTTVNVSIISNGSFAFSPQTLNITVGTIVIWKNNTTAPHTVSSDNGAFDSATISPGGTFSFKFTQAGTFAYHCMIHPFMTATVIVK